MGFMPCSEQLIRRSRSLLWDRAWRILRPKPNLVRDGTTYGRSLSNKGQPFGAESAEPNFYRFAAGLKEAGRSLLKLITDHSFDDFFIIEPDWLANSGLWSFNRLAKAVSLMVEPILSFQGFKMVGIYGFLSELCTTSWTRYPRDVEAETIPSGWFPQGH
jgi:hypothetical protein